MKKAVFHLSLLVLILGASAQQIFACECSVTQPVDVAFVNTPNIVVMKLRSVEKYRAAEQAFGLYGIRRSRLTVEKVYKGDLKVGQDLFFSQGGGKDCLWTFREEGIGDAYLFYLGSKSGKKGTWPASTCSRSNLIQDAAADLLYLDQTSWILN